MNLKLLLGQLLSEDIDEAAAAIGQAKTENLALFINKNGHEPGIILYRPSVALCGVEDYMRNNEVKFRNISSGVFDEAVGESNAIVGYLSFEKNDADGAYQSNVYTVNLSGAEQGYGPLMYDLAMSVVSPYYLASDRHSVSRSAQRVWAYYFDKRNDVEKKLIPRADDIQVYGKVIPSISVGGALRDIVHAAWECQTKISRLQKMKPFKYPSILGPEYVPMDIPAEIEKLQQQQADLAQEYKKGVLDNPLAYMYRIQKRIPTDVLVKNHNWFIRSAHSKYNQLSGSEIHDALVNAADAYARAKIP